MLESSDAPVGWSNLSSFSLAGQFLPRRSSGTFCIPLFRTFWPSFTTMLALSRNFGWCLVCPSIVDKFTFFSSPPFRGFGGAEVDCSVFSLSFYAYSDTDSLDAKADFSLLASWTNFSSFRISVGQLLLESLGSLMNLVLPCLVWLVLLSPACFCFSGRDCGLTAFKLFFGEQ